jgi:hypothetical protein
VSTPTTPKNLLRTALLALAVAPLACGGAKAPTAQAPDFAAAHAKALREEATGDDAKAAVLYADLLALAAQAPESAGAEAAVVAALDALAFREVPGIAVASEDTALAYRLPPGPRADLQKRLEAAYASADDPLVPGLVARALQALAERDGDAKAATRWRSARGCAQSATLVGPTTWTPIIGAAEPSPLAKPGTPLAGAAGPGPLSPRAEPVVFAERGCWIDPSAASHLVGVRDVVVDVEVPRAGRVGVALRADMTARLWVGGTAVADRPYRLGGGDVTRAAVVDAGAGRLRIVARVGLDRPGERLEIDAWDEHGKPLALRAPAAGEAAPASATASKHALAAPSRTDEEKALAAAAAIALGDAREAEALLWAPVQVPGAVPELVLLYARALAGAEDVPASHRSERLRALHERVLDRWPGAWESVLAHAELAATRKGQTEARLEALTDLDQRRGKASPSGAALLDAYDAATSGQEGVHDRARAAWDRAEKRLAGARLLHDVGRVAFQRSGADRVAYGCDRRPPADQAALECYDALSDAGRAADARAELDRLRQLRGAPKLLLAFTARDALVHGDMDAAKKTFAAMLPGERTLSLLGAIGPEGAAAQGALRKAAATSADAPYGLAPLLRVLAADDPLAELDGRARKAIDDDRKKPAMPDAGTAVLVHEERYDLGEDGLVHVVQLDVRRVGGTTDVEMNAAASAPELDGRALVRSLRRRVFKRDGRVLEPDPTPNAAQAHADLSQLEKGDYVEAVYEGWALPRDTGDVGFEGSDLLPDRTAVVHAEITVSVPERVRGALWAHPLLGKARESRAGGTRTLVWTLDGKPSRRIEDGVPKMDRGVRVLYSTEQWDHVGDGLREVVASLEDHAPEVDAWAREASRGKPAGTREQVEAVVAAAGEMVRESRQSPLVDIVLGRSTGTQDYTARSILGDREGSRTWLVVRALRALGTAADVVIAENDPYSADAAMPPRVGRFMHPLAVAHVKTKDGKPEDVWIDADVAGPPLPAGRISPELRGRMALFEDGHIRPLPATGSDELRDEIDLRLALDAKGNARGSLTILLRGRAAQEIAQALFRVVGFERQRALRNIALGWVPFADVDDVVLSSSEGSWQVSIRAELSVPAYGQPEGTGAQASWVLPGLDPLHTVFPRPYVATLASTYASQGARESALAVSRAVQYHVHRRVDLPPGAAVVRPAGVLGVKGARLEGSRKVVVQGNAVEDDFVLAVTTGTVAADRYEAFVADARAIDAGFLASTRVKPPTP